MMKEKESFWDKLFVFKVYAARGYVSLLGWIFTIAIFIFELYNPLMLAIPELISIFPNVFIFMAVAAPVILVVLAYAGRWDWKSGTFPKEGKLAFQNNPEWMEHRDETENRLDDIHLKVNKMDEVINNTYGAINDILGLLED